MSAELLYMAAEQIDLDIEDLFITGPDEGEALADLLAAIGKRAAEICETVTNESVRAEVLPSAIPGYREALRLARLIVGDES